LLKNYDKSCVDLKSLYSLKGNVWLAYVLPWGQMSFWGATVITNVRGSKVPKMSWFQGNNLISDEGKGKLSNFQTVKKILWKIKREASYDNWNKVFHRDVKLSSCNNFTKYLTDLSIVKCIKSLNFLRKTIVNFRWTHVTAKWKTKCYTKAELVKAEGRSDRIQDKVIWKLKRKISQYNQYLVKKGTRLFSTINNNEIKQPLVVNINEGKITARTLISSDSTQVKEVLCLYKIVIQKENLIEAFKSLTAKALPGLDGQIKVHFSEQLNKSLIKLHKDLRKHKYKPNPIKTIYIPKPSGGKRPLGISSVRDKIVQTSLKNELEKIYEPIFRSCSYGFRPKLSCHSALKQIKKNWQTIKWFISLDISKCFDKIQHEILISVLKKKVHDQEFIDLMRKFLNVGYVDIHNLTNRGRYKTEKAPQISILSPLMCNILLHQLDEFIENELIPEFTKDNFIVANKTKNYLLENTLLKKFPTNLNVLEWSKLKNIIPILKRNEKILEKNAFYYKEENFHYKQLYYVRYSDDIILGCLGIKDDCKKIIKKINKYMQNSLKLELDLSISSINLAWEKPTYFLGFELRQYQNTKISKTNNIWNKPLKQCIINSISLTIPIKKILNSLVKERYLRKVSKTERYKGKGVGKLSSTSDKKIVLHFSRIIKNYVNYYACANKRSKLWCIINTLRDSCYLTLAWKHKFKTKKQVKKKFGPTLKVYENGKLITELFYPKSLKTELKFLDRSYEGFLTNLQQEVSISDNQENKREAKKCALCQNTKNLELHRVNSLKNKNKKTFTNTSNKKIITLCITCCKSPTEISETKNMHIGTLNPNK
jgi:group II intron reverse transcriptase/maturase